MQGADPKKRNANMDNRCRAHSRQLKQVSARFDRRTDERRTTCERNECFMARDKSVRAPKTVTRMIALTNNH